MSLNRGDISTGLANRESGQAENDVDPLSLSLSLLRERESSNTGSASLVSAIAALNCGK